MTILLANMVQMGRLNRIPILKQEIKKEKNLSVGFWTYPIGQAADILSIGANTVYIGSDQVSILEFANELRKKINQKYGDIFHAFAYKVGDKLSGTDGTKMSKSKGNTIYLTDTLAEIQKKVNQIPTSSDKDIRNNLVFHMLERFHPNVKQLKERYEKEDDYGDEENKKALIDCLYQFTQPFVQKRATITNEMAEQAIQSGNQKVQEISTPLYEQLKQVL